MSFETLAYIKNAVGVPVIMTLVNLAQLSELFFEIALLPSTP